MGDSDPLQTTGDALVQAGKGILASVQTATKGRTNLAEGESMFICTNQHDC